MINKEDIVDGKIVDGEIRVGMGKRGKSNLVEGDIKKRCEFFYSKFFTSTYIHFCRLYAYF